MKRATDKTFAWAMTLLGVIALALCIFMAVHAMNGTHMIGCSAGSSCDSVMNSRWSSLFGLIPVSLPAAGLYLAFLLCCVAGAVSDDEELRTMARNCMIAIAGAVSVASIWFIALQLFAVHNLCRYCMAAHTVGIIISIAVIMRFFSDKKSRMWLAGGAFAGVVFAVIQLLTAPSSVYDAGFVEEPLPAVSGMNEPLIGNPDAEHVVEILFDYQCSHCRTMHPWLEEIAEDGDVAFVLCPSPLSPSCNPYIPRDVEDRFVGSCDLARLALAVWTVDNDKFYEFDHWLFGYGSDSWLPRPVDEAREKAADLIGETRLSEAMTDPWIDSYLSLVFELFGRTTSEGHSGIPRLISGQKWLVPEAGSAEELRKLLEQIL